MTKLGLLGAAGVILSSALASPVTAQEVIYNPGYCAPVLPERQLPEQRTWKSLHRELSAPGCLSEQ